MKGGTHGFRIFDSIRFVNSRCTPPPGRGLDPGRKSATNERVGASLRVERGTVGVDESSWRALEESSRPFPRQAKLGSPRISKSIPCLDHRAGMG